MARGARIEQRVVATRQDLAILARVMWTCVLRASPKRAWMTISLLLESAIRRPRTFRDAVTLSLVHKHLYEYMRDVCRRLESLADDVPMLPPNMADLSGSQAGVES